MQVDHLNLKKEAKRRAYGGLDALRGVAAIAVLSRHAPAFFGVSMFPNSALCVDLFFVLSGFVIAHAYDHRLNSGLTLKEFVLLRLIRLYPLYCLGTLIGIFVAVLTLTTGVTSDRMSYVWSARDLVKSALLSLALLPTPPLAKDFDSLYPLNAVAWSLGFEIVINVLYAAFHRFLSTRVLLIAIIVDAILLVGAIFYVGDTDLGWNWRSLAFGLTRIFFSFPAGVLLHRVTQGARRGPAVSIAWPIIIFVLVLKIGPPPPIGLGFSAFAILFVFPALTYFAGAAKISPAMTGPCAFLGVTSYAVYALHRPVLSVINGAAQVLHLRLVDWFPVAGIIFVGFYLTLCWLVDLYFDQPVRRWLTRELRPRARQPSAQAQP